MPRASTKEAREDRRHKTLELRLAGHGIRAIARKQGIAVGTVCSDLDLMLGQLADQHAAEVSQLRSIQNRRYEKLLTTVWDKAKAGNLQALDRCIALLGRIDSIHGLSSEKSIAVLVNHQVNQLNIQPVSSEILAGYGQVIREIAAAQDNTVESDPLAEFQDGNGHRESFKV